jgi:5'-nucleotidase/UDP-sugar diphosphatase
MFVQSMRVSSVLLFVLVYYLCIHTDVSALMVRSNARAEAPTPITFTQYAAHRKAGTHPGLTQLHSQTVNTPIPSPSQNAVHVTFVHFNDLYELIASGSIGGVARFATLVKNVRQMGTHPSRTVSVLAGDLFSPSALSTVPVPGMPTGFQGKQMVAAMNALGLNVSTLGNHETDVKMNDFLARLSESQFPWICNNALNLSYPNLSKDGKTFTFGGQEEGVPTVTIGVWGTTLDSNNKAYESYDNFTTTLVKAAESVAQLQAENVDAVVALTHLPYYHDTTMVQTVSGIDIVMGGHEHIAMTVLAPHQTPIYKADSNVHSAWIHDFYIDPTLSRDNPQRLVIQSVLVQVDAATLAEDVEVGAAINAYVNEAFDGFESEGFHPRAYLATPTVDLVGTNDWIFAQDSSLTHIFNLALLEECNAYRLVPGFAMPPVDATLFNSGAIRIDDTIDAGTVMTQYDAIRISPYSNAVALVNMSGLILQSALDASQLAQNSSQFLHFYPNITVAVYDASKHFIEIPSPAGFVYTINSHPLLATSDHWYSVGLLGFLLGGGRPYSMLKPSKQLMVLQWDQTTDVRKSVLDQIAIMFPSASPPNGGGGSGSLWSHHWFQAFIFGLVVVIIATIVFVWIRKRKAADAARKARSDEYMDGGDIEWSPTHSANRRPAYNRF